MARARLADARGEEGITFLSLLPHAAPRECLVAGTGLPTVSQMGGPDPTGGIRGLDSRRAGLAPRTVGGFRARTGVHRTRERPLQLDGSNRSAAKLALL